MEDWMEKGAGRRVRGGGFEDVGRGGRRGG